MIFFPLSYHLSTAVDPIFVEFYDWFCFIFIFFSRTPMITIPLWPILEVFIFCLFSTKILFCLWFFYFIFFFFGKRLLLPRLWLCISCGVLARYMNSFLLTNIIHVWDHPLIISEFSACFGTPSLPHVRILCTDPYC